MRSSVHDNLDPRGKSRRAVPSRVGTRRFDADGYADVGVRVNVDGYAGVDADVDVDESSH